jgi:hypothetical protein
MDVIIMLSTISLIKKLKVDYPQFSFIKGASFSWSHSESTIYYADTDDDLAYLFHELSHALLGHTSYDRDIQLMAMEREAWDYTIKLAPKYDVAISNDMVQSTLDTYRDWLHKRSTCPKCTANGLQTAKRTYKCLACGHIWYVNDAKTCALRRYSNKV